MISRSTYHCARYFLLVSAVLLNQASLRAQNSAAGGQATPQTAPSLNAQPSGLLTPPSDTSAPSTNAAPSAAPAMEPIAPTTTTTVTKTVSTSTSTPMSSAEVARIQQQEVIRKQELSFRANEALSTGRKAELGNDYPIARQNYLFAAEALGSISRATTPYANAADGLTRVDFQLSDDALKRGDTDRAKQLIEEILKYNPNNKAANERLLVMNRALANPNDTSILGNPAITPGFVKKVNEVDQLFAEAEQFRRTGQWDEAEARLKHILGIDPYNIAASKALERIDAEKYDYAEKARVETRDERLRQVEEKWYEPINNKDISTNAQEAQPTLVRATNFDLDQRLRSIFVSLNFTEATIEEATNFLSLKSKELDPEHKGVNFIIQPQASSSAKPITLVLNNVPLGEALRYVCQLAGVKNKVQDYAISIVPLSFSTDDLISRTFIVPPSFIAPPQAAASAPTETEALFGARPIAPVTPAAPTTPGGESGTGTDTVQAALEAKGVKFPPGASAVYTPTNGQLTVVDTADQMELLEELVNAGQAPTLMVRIATKFVEINQEDLNDLTVNTSIGHSFKQFGNSNVTAQFVTNLAGSRAITSDNIDSLITPANGALNTIQFGGAIGHVAFEAVFNSLSQKRSFDLLSEPAVLTKSGEQGTLEAIRVFPFPIAFDPPTLVTPPTLTGGTTGTTVVTLTPPAVIPSTPTDFKRRNIGVRLVVKPQIVADNKTIDLSLFPEVTDFEGFINYGSPIYVGNPAGYGLPTESLLSSNVINQPVFNTRRINTKVLIHDGSTIIMGGLLRDDVQTVNDRVPVLGDLPLIGRLFQSKAIQNTKRNLIIFVTANIYRNDGELLNPPEVANAADVLTGHTTFTPIAAP